MLVVYLNDDPFFRHNIIFGSWVYEYSHPDDIFNDQEEDQEQLEHRRYIYESWNSHTDVELALAFGHYTIESD